MGVQVLVTGGAGFLGRHVVLELLRREQVDAVVALDDASFGDPGRLDGLPVRIRDASVLDRDAVQDELARADAVVHLATRWADGAGVADPLGVHDVNTTATVRLMAAVADSPGTRLVLCPLTEPIGPPRDAVEAASIAVTAAAAAARTSAGLEVAQVRLPDVIGPGHPLGHPRGGWVVERIRRILREDVLDPADGVDHGAGRIVVDAATAAVALVDAAVSATAVDRDVTGHHLSDLEIAAHVSRETGRPVEVHAVADPTTTWRRPDAAPGVAAAVAAMVRDELSALV